MLDLARDDRIPFPSDAWMPLRETGALLELEDPGPALDLQAVRAWL